MKNILFFILFLVIANTAHVQEPVISQIYGSYKLLKIEDNSPTEEVRIKVVDWIYRGGFDTITIESDIITFGGYTANIPTYIFLPINDEDTVYFPNSRHSQVCSNFFNFFPEINRQYNFVLVPIELGEIWFIEILNNRHIVVKLNVFFLLFEKQ